MLTPNRKSASGMTLIELMVGLAVGMMIIASALAIYIVASKSGRETLNSAKLNQELRGAMDAMVSDVRRAGFWGTAAAGTNPFTQRTGTVTDLNLFDLDGDTGNGFECVLLSYDATYKGSAAGVVDSEDYFGYKLVNGAVSMREGNGDGNATASCAGSTGWESLTDSDNVVVDTLSFTLEGSQCLNATTNATWAVAGGNTPACDPAAPGYVAPTSGDRMIETRQVLINLSGHHIKDDAMIMTLSQSVRLRNDRTFVAP